MSRTDFVNPPSKEEEMINFIKNNEGWKMITLNGKRYPGKNSPGDFYARGKGKTGIVCIQSETEHHTYREVKETETYKQAVKLAALYNNAFELFKLMKRIAETPILDEFRKEIQCLLEKIEK